MTSKEGVLRLVAAAAAVAAAVGASVAPASAHEEHSASSAVFVQTDEVLGNRVIAYDRAADGTLHQKGTYSTGGDGYVLPGSQVDHLASEGSLVLDRRHGLLFAVNAGSDTLTVFGVEGDRLVRRQVIGSGGRTPVSVAVHGNTVYVLNALDGGSVQGFVQLGGRLMRMPGWHRALGLHTDVTTQFTGTPGQIAFTPDGSRLVVTTKAGGQGIDVFRVHGLLGLSGKPVITSTPGAVPFGFTFDTRGRLVVTEAGPSAVATFRIRRDGTAALLKQEPTGQAATCWITSVGDTHYASNAGSGSLSGYTTDGRGGLHALGNTSTGPGTVDAAASSDGRFLYVQTGATGGVDGFRVNHDGSLAKVGSVSVPDAVGAEGIAAE